MEQPACQVAMLGASTFTLFIITSMIQIDIFKVYPFEEQETLTWFFIVIALIVIMNFIVTQIWGYYYDKIQWKAGNKFPFFAN